MKDVIDGSILHMKTGSKSGPKQLNGLIQMISQFYQTIWMDSFPFERIQMYFKNCPNNLHEEHEMVFPQH